MTQKKACPEPKGSKKTLSQLIRMVWCPNSIFQADEKVFLCGKKEKACEQMPEACNTHSKDRKEKRRGKKSACILSANQLSEGLYH